MILFLLISGCEKKQGVGKEEITEAIEQNKEPVINDTPAQPVEQYINPDEVKQFLLGYWYASEGYNEWRNKKGVVYKTMTTDGREFVNFGNDSKFSRGIMATESGYDGDWSVRGGSSSILLDMKWGLSREGTWKIEKIDQNHINITFRDENGQTARFTREETGIKKGIDNDNIEELRRYLRNGGDINERMLFDYTPLMYAIRSKKTNSALFLIEQGADLSLQSVTGYTALHYVILSFDFEENILLSILEKGVDVNIRDEFVSRDGSRYSQTVLDLTLTEEPDENTRQKQKLLSQYGAVCSKKEWQDEVNNAISRVMIFKGHFKDVSVAFSPDGSRIVSGSWDRTIRLWDISSGGLIRRFVDQEGYAHSKVVYSVAFSPDGSQIASCSADGTIKLWDTSTGNLIRTFSGHSKDVMSVAFSPDGGQIVSGSADKTVKLWNTVTGLEIRTFSRHVNNVHTVAFSPDGRHILSGSSDRTIKLWDVSSGREIREYRGSWGEVVREVAFSPDGSKIASTFFGEGMICFMDIAMDRITGTFSEPSDVILSIAFSPDGSRIAAGYLHDRIILWNTDTGKIETVFKADSIVNSVAFSPDGRYIVAATEIDNLITLWDTSIVRR